MRKLIKILIVVGVLALTATLAGAELLTYFGHVHTTINVIQSVMIDDNTTTIIDTIDNAVGGNTVYSTPSHFIRNNADSVYTIVWWYSVTPYGDGFDSIKCVDPTSHAEITSVPAHSYVDFVFEYVLSNDIVSGQYIVTADLHV